MQKEVAVIVAASSAFAWALKAMVSHAAAAAAKSEQKGNTERDLHDDADGECEKDELSDLPILKPHTGTQRQRSARESTAEGAVKTAPVFSPYPMPVEQRVRNFTDALMRSDGFEHARTHSLLALSDADQRSEPVSFTYPELCQVVDEVSTALRFEHTRGERVALFCNNSPQYVCFLLAVLNAGLVAVLIGPHEPVHRLRSLISDSGATSIFCSRSTASKVFDLRMDESAAKLLPGKIYIADMELMGTTPLSRMQHYGRARAQDIPPLEEVESSADALVCYSRSLVGEEKGLVFSHQSLFDHMQQLLSARLIGGAPETMLAMQPLHILAHLTPSVLLPLATGAHVVTMRVFEREHFLRSVHAYSVTVTKPSFKEAQFLSSSPLVQTSEGAGSSMWTLCKLLVSPTPLPPGIVNAIHQRIGAITVQLSGVAECAALTHVAFLSSEMEETKVGCLAPGVEATMAERNVYGAVQEVRIKTMGKFSRYTDSSSLGSVYDSGGWLRTGEMGSCYNGTFYVEGNLSGAIENSIATFLPEQLERLIRHYKNGRAVVDVGVAGLPAGHIGRLSSEGSVAVAWVVTSLEAYVKLGELQTFLKDIGVPEFMMPRRLRRIEAIPRASDGHIQRSILVSSEIRSEQAG